MCRALNLLFDKQQEINKIRKDKKKIWYRKAIFLQSRFRWDSLRKGNNTMSYN